MKPHVKREEAQQRRIAKLEAENQRLRERIEELEEVLEELYVYAIDMAPEYRKLQEPCRRAKALLWPEEKPVEEESCPACRWMRRNHE